jgi:hypothetical protein
MKPVRCPLCGSQEIFHYTDAYVLRRPYVNEVGTLDLVEDQTNEYDDCFFECMECGCRPTEDELLSSGASGLTASNEGQA